MENGTPVMEPLAYKIQVQYPLWMCFWTYYQLIIHILWIHVVVWNKNDAYL